MQKSQVFDTESSSPIRSLDVSLHSNGRSTVKILALDPSNCFEISCITGRVSKTFHLDDRNDANKEPHEVPPCVCHGLLLGSCPTRITNVLQITKEIVNSGMPNRDCIKNPVGYLKTEVWKEDNLITAHVMTIKRDMSVWWWWHENSGRMQTCLFSII